MANAKLRAQFVEDAKALSKLLTADNIVSMFFCQTRLRIVLKDPKIVDIKAIDNLESVQGTFIKGGQFQIIIGTDVPEFYKLFREELGMEESSQKDVKAAVNANQNRFQKILTAFGEIFLPLIPIIVAGGLILAFRNILELDWNGPDKAGGSAVGSSEFASYLNSFLWLPANAIFWYLPVGVVWSIFNRKDVVPALGIIIGITLVSPGILVNLYDVSGAMGQIHVSTGLYGTAMGADNEEAIISFLAPGNYSPDAVSTALITWANFVGVDQNVIDKYPLTTPAEITSALIAAEGSIYNIDTSVAEPSYLVTNIFLAISATEAYFFGVWPLALSYVGQVIPAMLVGAFGVWVYQFVERHTWSSVKYVWPPFVTILVVDVFAHGIIGPIGAVFAFAVTFIFKWGFTNQYAMYVFAPIFGALYSVIVITGLHQTFNAVMITLTIQEANYIFPILAISNVCQGAAVFAVVYLARGNAKMKEVGNPAAVTCWLGVTEPAMYGVNLKYLFPFLAAMCGSAVASTFDVALQITANGIGMGGVLGFLNINHIVGVAPKWSAWIVYIAIMALGVVVTFFLTILFSRIKFFKKFETGSWDEVMEEARKGKAELKSKNFNKQPTFN